MSAVPSAQLDPGAVIGQAFDLYKKHAGVLLPAAFGLYAIQALATLLLTNGNLLTAFLLNVVTIALSTIYTGAVVQLVRDAQDGSLDSSVGQIVASVLPVVVPLILVSIVAAILVGVGLIFLLVPGLYLLTLFAVIGPVTVIEKPGVFTALGRSRDLVKGNGWQVFGLILLVVLLSIVASIIAAIIGAPLGTTGRGIVQWIASALLAPIGALATALAYLRLREFHGEAPLSAGVASAPGDVPPPAGPSGVSGIPGA